MEHIGVLLIAYISTLLDFIFIPIILICFYWVRAEKIIRLLDLYGYNEVADELKNVVRTIGEFPKFWNLKSNKIFFGAWKNFRKLKIEKQFKDLWRLQLRLKIYYVGTMCWVILPICLIPFTLICLLFFYNKTI